MDNIHMMDNYQRLIFVDDFTKETNWFYRDYSLVGNNARYFTFQITLNLLAQLTTNPVIIETGCQREENDFGAGMSTSIFAEYIYQNGGKLIVVDNCEEHLERAKGYLSKWPTEQHELVLSDSVTYLKEYNGPCDLLYLDSYDFPVDGNHEEEVAAQRHCLQEFLAIEDRLSDKTILLIDDNLLPNGGKPKLLKQYLSNKNWICIMDYQQSLWLKANNENTLSILSCDSGV